MDDAAISSFIQDPELRMLAKTHGLDDWEWGTEDRRIAALMMEGAAIAIRAIYDEGRDVSVHVHQSGTTVIWSGAYFHYQINPKDEIKEVDHAFDWESDPVIKQYECKNELTLAWLEKTRMEKKAPLRPADTG